MVKVQQKPTRGLGKGLSALITQNPGGVSADVADKDLPKELPIALLMAGKYQPRGEFDDESLRELAISLKSHGMMQPIVVRVAPAHAGRYEIIAGERRFRAAQIAKFNAVPVIIREISDKQALELAIVENVQRKDLNPLEEASGYRRLIDEFDYTQETLSQAIGKSRSHIANLVRLLSLPEEVKKMMQKGQLTSSHARVLLNAEDPLTLARGIVAGSLNVREAEDLYRQAQGREKMPHKPRATTTAKNNRAASGKDKDTDVRLLEDTLSETLGLKVQINARGQGGEVTVGYNTLAELDKVLKRLGGGA